MDRPVPRFALLRRPSAAGLPPGLVDTVVDWARYADGVRGADVRFDEALERAASGDGFVWVAVENPNQRQLAMLCRLLDVPAHVQEVLHVGHRPRSERGDDLLAVAMRTLAYVERHARTAGGDVVETGTMTVVVGPCSALTVRFGRGGSSGRVRRRLEADPQRLAHGPAAVLHGVVDQVVDDYLAVVDAVDDDIEEIEVAVFSARAASDVERVYQLKRDVIEMKRLTAAVHRPLHDLAERPHPLVPEEVRGLMTDVADHLDRVREHVASFDELLSSVLQASLARASVAETEDMRKISAWVVIAAVPTMIAGIYGMNFDGMLGADATWGYPAVLALMMVVCLLIHRGFRRNGWL